jgi:hypothetical protein
MVLFLQVISIIFIFMYEKIVINSFCGLSSIVWHRIKKLEKLKEKNSGDKALLVKSDQQNWKRRKKLRQKKRQNFLSLIIRKQMHRQILIN